MDNKEIVEKNEDVKKLYYEGLSYCYVKVVRLDAQRALECLHASAEAGNADSYYVIGDIYNYGLAGDPDPDAALQYYMRGHAIGSVKCTYGVAICTKDADTQNMRYAEAFDRLFQEAHEGDEISQFIVSRYFAQGLAGKEKNLNAYFYWLLESAINGYLYAMQEAGDCFRDGFCVDADEAIANEWYAKSGMPLIEGVEIVYGGEAEQMSLDDINAPQQNQPNEQEASQPIESETQVDAEELTESNEVEEQAQPSNQDVTEADVDEQQQAPEQSTEIEEQSYNEDIEQYNAEEAPSLEESTEQPTDEYIYEPEEEDDVSEQEEVESAEALPEQVVEDEEAVETAKFNEAMTNAQAGDPNAQLTVALCYETGKGVELNYDEAVKWYALAAENDVAQAYNNLGIYYQRGISVQRDVFKAAEYYRKAAIMGYAPAQYNLATCHIECIGVKKSYVEAARLLSEAAYVGYAPAQYLLALLYQTGKGIAQSWAKAAELYHDAYIGGIEEAGQRAQRCKERAEEEANNS